MITNNIIFISVFIFIFSSWFFFLCQCFFNLNNVDKIFFERLYDIHYRCFENHQCKWFKQIVEAIRRQKTLQIIQKMQQKWHRQKEKKRRTKQIEEARLIKNEVIRIVKEKTIRLTAKAFACKRCIVKFFNNTQLHCHIRDRHAKKSKIFSFTFTFTSQTFISSSVFSSSKSISWIEVISRSMTSSKFSRISLSTALFILSLISSHSSILQIFKLINNITKSFFITYFTMQNLYIKFHDKLKFSSFFVKQIRLSFAFFFEQMRFRQMRIISYFKSVDNNQSSEFLSKIKLVSNRKCVDFRASAQSIWNRDLTLVRHCITQDRFFVNSICFCLYHFLNHSSIYDRKYYMTESQHSRKIKIV